MPQHTIAQTVACAGAALHAGVPVRVTLRAAPVGAGVVFARVDRPDRVEVPAVLASVRATPLATALGGPDEGVETVEHLLAAALAAGVDNLRVEVEGPELPALDGSAAPWLRLLERAGVRGQDARRRVRRVARVVEVRDGERWIRAEPSDGLRIEYALAFDHPAIGRQAIDVAPLSPGIFERELARARTFGFLAEAPSLRAAGRGRGASLENTIVLDESSVMNPGGLRFPDEFVRHKVVDLLGDLALLGAPLCGLVRVERGGHALHRALVAALLRDPATCRLEPADATGGSGRVTAPGPAA